MAPRVVAQSRRDLNLRNVVEGNRSGKDRGQRAREEDPGPGKAGVTASASCSPLLRKRNARSLGWHLENSKAAAGEVTNEHSREQFRTSYIETYLIQN